ncbi:MAG TPA: bifunctional 4-hydroxy-2-oxoglutarate aldolase/2-dehydro-3-deoxy-phosphogluconate aldolase [Micromonosporaceae bacterium]|nr:bifunctional 4-hydroxy-2-oxoglutarate aldolase/2-dehydro-3-deoxy-phosphogluconate aldolase [Micromonosporaceae bacterium]
MHLRDVLQEHRLVAIVRGDDPDRALESILVLAESGITLIEVSLTATDGVGVIARARAELGPHALLGAGMVLSESDVVQVEQAGASFIATPAVAPAVGEAVRIGLPALVGAFTPSEALAATLAGAAAVKLFPASIGGPGYLRTLCDCFPEVAFVPAGGVAADLVTDYLSAGALAVGVGAALLADAPRGGDLGRLRERATTFLTASQQQGLST